MFTTQIYYNQLKGKISIIDILFQKNKYLGTSKLAKLLKVSPRTLQRKKKLMTSKPDYTGFYIDFNFNHFSLLDTDTTEYAIMAILNAIASPRKMKYAYMSLGSIANILNIERHTVGYKVNELVKKGLLEKVRRPSKNCLRYNLILKEKWFDSYEASFKLDIFGENHKDIGIIDIAHTNKTATIEIRPETDEIFDNDIENSEEFGPGNIETYFDRTINNEESLEIKHSISDYTGEISLPYIDNITKKDIEKYVKNKEIAEAIWVHYKINIKDLSCDKSALEFRITRYIKDNMNSQYLNQYKESKEINTEVGSMNIPDNIDENDIKAFFKSEKDQEYAWELYSRYVSEGSPEIAKEKVLQYLQMSL